MWPQPPPPPRPEPPLHDWRPADDDAPPPPRRRSRRRAAAVVAALLAAVAGAATAVAVSGGHNTPKPVGGNGESQKSAQDIIGDAALAFAALHRVHVSGGAHVQGFDETYDLHVSDTGTEGSLSLDGVPVQVILIDDDLYMRGRQFWDEIGGPGAGAAIGDRWVHTTTDDPDVAKVRALLTLTGLQQIISQAVMDGSGTRGTPKKVDGVMAVPVQFSDAEIDVAVDGKPYPCHLHADAASIGTVDIAFDLFDVDRPAPQRPPGAIDRLPDQRSA